MLYGYIGKDKYKDKIPDFIDGWFSVRFEPSWADSGFMGRCIREIDKSEYLPPYNVISPVFGSISLDMLSGGTKTLIQIDNMPDSIFLSSYLGDNCVPLLFDIAQRKDVKLLFNHCLDIGDRDVYFPDFDVTVHSTEGLAQFLYEHRDVYKKGWSGNYDW